MAHFMNSEISTPLICTLEYTDVFSFLFILSTLKLFRFSRLEMYVYNESVNYFCSCCFCAEWVVYACTVTYYSKISCGGSTTAIYLRQLVSSNH